MPNDHEAESMIKTQAQRPKTADVVGIILAAGQSSRMGAFKPLLPFGKQTVIEACVDYLHSGGVETIVVVLGHNADQVRARLKDASVLFALNSDPSSEMAESIRCGLEMLPANTHATLIALVDHPAVPSHVVKTLIDEWRHGAQLIIPTWQDRGGHPVLVDLHWRDDLKRLDPSGGLKSFFHQHPDAVRRAPVGSPYVARDMDTWDDYTRLHLDVFGQAPPARDDSNETPFRTI